MSSILRSSLLVCFFIFAVVVLMLVPSVNYNANAQQCSALICKDAPQLPPAQSEGELVFFTFEVEPGPGNGTIEIAANGRCIQFGIAPGGNLRVVEQPLEGWTLADIECSNALGVTTEFIENGVIFNCDAQNSEINIECDFVNLIETNVPTLSEWGMIAAAAGLGLIGVFFAVRRRRMPAGS